MILWATPMAIACGCVALAARSSATWGAVVVTAAVGAIGALAPAPSDQGEHPGVFRWLGTAGLGVAAFAIGRWLRMPVIPDPMTTVAVLANLLAAVAEELFFRRLMYGWMVRWGPGLAIGGTAVAFAVVHVPAYGIQVLPIDLAAGLLFGWQRWATGGWSASALTHAAANLLQMG